MFGVNGQTNANTIVIDQGLIENSVSEHYNVILQLNFNA